MRASARVLLWTVGAGLFGAPAFAVGQPKLVWHAPCSFAYEDGTPFEDKVPSYACRYLDAKGGPKTFNAAGLPQQKERLLEADLATRKALSDYRALLDATDPKTLSEEASGKPLAEHLAAAQAKLQAQAPGLRETLGDAAFGEYDPAKLQERQEQLTQAASSLDSQRAAERFDSDSGIPAALRAHAAGAADKDAPAQAGAFYDGSTLKGLLEPAPAFQAAGSFGDGAAQPGALAGAAESSDLLQQRYAKADAAPPAPASGRPETPDQEVDRLTRENGYTPEINRHLHMMVRYADPLDTQKTLEAISAAKPRILLDPDVGRGYGSYGEQDAEENTVRIAPGFATDKKGHELPLGKQGFDDEMQSRRDKKPDASEPVLRKAPQAVAQPDAWVKEGYEDKNYKMRYREYPDGSRRYYYSDVSLTGTLMHEVGGHTLRAASGGGANSYTDEKAAFNIEGRFYTNYQERHGGKLPVDSTELELVTTWQKRPAKFDSDMRAEYLSNGEFNKEEITIAQQKPRALQRAMTQAELERALADYALSGGPVFEPATRRFLPDVIKPARPDYPLSNLARSCTPAPVVMNQELLQLAVDERMDKNESDYQDGYRARKEAEYREALKARLAAEQDKAARNAALTQEQRQKALDAAAARYKQDSSDLWSGIPKMSLP